MDELYQEVIEQVGWNTQLLTVAFKTKRGIANLLLEDEENEFYF